MAVAFDQDLGTSTGATPVTNAFELLIALLSLIAAVGFFLYPESLYRSSVGRALHPYDYAWNGALRLAGVAIVLGVLMSSASPEGRRRARRPRDVCHDVEKLLERGCSPDLAPDLVR